MKQVILKKAVYSNFKGIRNFELNPNINHTEVYGDNGVGKTTLRDGYLWCLTGRDSLDRTNHEIRPRNKDNSIIHHLDSFVELTFEVDGSETKLKRVYKELWSRKTGEVDRSYNGNTTDYYVDDVKIGTKSQYDKEVGSIFNSDLIQLLSDPYYFTSLDWQTQRKYLFGLINVSDTDVVAKNKELDGFLDNFKADRLEDSLKALNSNKRAITADIKDMESKIDENSGLLGEKGDWDNIDEDISSLKSKISDIDKLIGNTSTAYKKAIDESNKKFTDKYNKIRDEISSLENKLSETLKSSSDLHNKELYDLKDKLEELSAERSRLDIEIAGAEVYNSQIESDIKALNKRREMLLNEYTEIKAREFSVDTICSTCGAIRGDIDSYKEEKLAYFNKTKASDLEENVRKGKEIASRIDKIKKDNKTIPSTVDVDNKIKDIKAKISEYPKYVEPKEVDVIRKSIESKKTQLANLKNDGVKVDIDKEVEKLKGEKDVLTEELEVLNRTLYEKEAYDKTEKRISELTSSIKASNLKLVEIDKSIYLIKLFDKTKNSIYQELVNEKFNVVKFTLFEYLVDGTPKPNCQALFKGIPFSTLNTGAKINVGLDIINTFSKHFKEKYPVFLDNKESVTKTIDIDSQLISLVVKENVKELTVLSN